MSTGAAAVRCKRCRVPMTELKGHIYHGNRKFRCPQCKRAKMQKPKKRRKEALKPE